MKTVIIKLDPKRVRKNALYFTAIHRVIIRKLEFDDDFNMRVFDQKIEISCDNEELINMLKELVEDEND